MNTIKLERAAWKPYFDDMNEVLAGKQAYIEVASLALGDQVQVEWAPLRGIAYDSKDDLIQLALQDLNHLIYGPKVVHVSYGDQGVEAIEIVDRDDVRQIVRLRAPLELPPPAGVGRGEESARGG